METEIDIDGQKRAWIKLKNIYVHVIFMDIVELRQRWPVVKLLSTARGGGSQQKGAGSQLCCTGSVIRALEVVDLK